MCCSRATPSLPRFKFSEPFITVLGSWTTRDGGTQRPWPPLTGSWCQQRHCPPLPATKQEVQGRAGTVLLLGRSQALAALVLGAVASKVSEFKSHIPFRSFTNLEISPEAFARVSFRSPWGGNDRLGPVSPTCVAFHRLTPAASSPFLIRLCNPRHRPHLTDTNHSARERLLCQGFLDR